MPTIGNVKTGKLTLQGKGAIGKDVVMDVEEDIYTRNDGFSFDDNRITRNIR